MCITILINKQYTAKLELVYYDNIGLQSYNTM